MTSRLIKFGATIAGINAEVESQRYDSPSYCQATKPLLTATDAILFRQQLMHTLLLHQADAHLLGVLHGLDRGETLGAMGWRWEGARA